MGRVTNLPASSKRELHRAALVSLGIVFTISAAAQDQRTIQDPAQLVGKKVNVQRIPLCQPGTYKVDLSHAGEEATVLSAKPSKSPQLSEARMARFTPELRAMMLDQQKAALLLLQFADGTKLDTCVPFGPNKLSEQLEILPGQILAPAAQNGTAASPTITPTAPAAALADLLPDNEVKLALSGKGRDHWELIWDKGLMAAQGNQVPLITLYMPEAVLAIRAESAKKQFIQYEPSDEDRRRSLMIVAQGYAGKTIAEGCTSITRVVLVSDPSGGVVKEAYFSEPLSETWRNNFGGTNNCQELRTKFTLGDVQEVKTAAPNGEFFVAVFSGTVNTKTYKIKKKYQSKLRLE